MYLSFGNDVIVNDIVMDNRLMVDIQVYFLII